MGTQGVPWNVKKSQIIEALKNAKGKITYAANALDCDYITLKKRIDADPELIELLDNLRNSFHTTLLDSAEDTLLYATNKKDQDLGNALKASFYILNNKGKERGYTGQVGSSSPISEQSLRDFIASNSGAIEKASATSESDESSLENQ